MTRPDLDPRIVALLDGFEDTSAALIAVEAIAVTFDALVDAHPLLAGPERHTAALRELVRILAEKTSAAVQTHQRECGLIHAMKGAG